jgi:hypothetical protein
VKRFCEPRRTRRPWLIWFYDTSKQGAGALVVHMANVYLASQFIGDACTWYVTKMIIKQKYLIFFFNYFQVHYKFPPGFLSGAVHNLCRHPDFSVFSTDKTMGPNKLWRIWSVSKLKIAPEENILNFFFNRKTSFV